MAAGIAPAFRLEFATGNEATRRPVVSPIHVGPAPRFAQTGD